MLLTPLCAIFIGIQVAKKLRLAAYRLSVIVVVLLIAVLAMWNPSLSETCRFSSWS
jgi:hypothetical protein